MTSKEELRKSVLEKRKSLSEHEYIRRNTLIAQKAILILKEWAPQSIHIYLPIRANKEPDTWPIIEWAWQNNVSVWSSQTDFTTKKLNPVILNTSTKIAYTKMGVPKPLADVQDSCVVDVIIVPLVSADRKGNRYGYGGGYYDKLLTAMPFTTIRCGLSLSSIFDKIWDIEPHDQPLDWVITPFEIVHCNKEDK